MRIFKPYLIALLYLYDDKYTLYFGESDLSQSKILQPLVTIKK